MLDSKKVIMEDVIYFNRTHIVTLSGNIYRYYNGEPQATEAKTKVKDIWLEGN